MAYKVSQNIICMEVQNKNIKLFLKLQPSDITDATPLCRDVTSIGHYYGTGDIQFTLSCSDDFEQMKQYVDLAYNKVDG
jgi:predicted transport protein